MQLLKLTAISSLLLVFATSLTSCEKEEEKKKNGSLYSKTDIPITGAQSVPATPSGGSGALAVIYTKSAKSLNYTFNWTGLTDTITAIVIQGPAPTGYASATVKQLLPGFPSLTPTTANLKTIQAAYPYQAASYTGSVIVDEFVFKEQDLLNHLYYLSIRTKAYPTGEIRAQIRFQ